MKILWLSHLLPYPPKGGVMQRSFNLIREASKECEIYLWAFNQKAWLPTAESVVDAKKNLERYCREVNIFHIPSDGSRFKWYGLVLFSLFSSQPYTVNWTTSSKMRTALWNFVRHARIDLIHCDTIGMAQYVGDKTNIPRVLNHHNIESHMMLRRAKKERNPLKKIYFFVEGIKLRNYEKHWCPLFNVNILVSDLDKERLTEMIPNIGTSTVPNGVDIDYFRPMNNNPLRHSLVFAGSMDWYPNEDAMTFFLKSIWPHLKQKYSEATLTIVGRNPPLKLKNLVSPDSSVTLTGYVDDVRPLIDQAEVYVCPIRDGGGTKLKLLDAMAMGKAIVSTSIGAEGFDLKNGEHLLIADEPGTFIEKIEILFENNELRQYLSDNARRFVEKYYDWEVIGKGLLDVYRLAG